MGELSQVALSGPLERYAEGFAGDLARQGYEPSTVVFHVRLLAHVSRWLEARGLDAAALDEAAGEAFLASRRASGRSARLRTGSLEPLLEYLRGIGAAPVPGPVPPATPADALLARYAGYLAAERGLSAKTIARNVTAIRPFLGGLAPDGQPGLGRLTAREVTGFVVTQSRQRPGTVPHLVTALRSLLRFLHVDGVTAAGLADAVPAGPGGSWPDCRRRCQRSR
jgi:integrase/recombinase XerD